MSKDADYRVVIDEITGAAIGVVKIDLNKWKGRHWIVDPDGDERKKYRYRRIDAAKYDTAMSFETHPVLEVRYKGYFHIFEDQEQFFGLGLLGAAGRAISCFYILGTVIIFSDLVPVLKNSLWYQSVYWLLTGIAVFGGLGLIASLISNTVVSSLGTRKDNKIEKWLEFKKQSEEGSSPDT